MNRLLLAAPLAALLLSGNVLADGHKHGHKHHGHDRVVRYEGHHDNGLHLGQYKHWARGERLPSLYLQPRYYISDYRAYRLAPPPQGYVWVRPYQDAQTYYMVQLATGLVSQIFGM